jgi:hypothetical protein
MNKQEIICCNAFAQKCVIMSMNDPYCGCSILEDYVILGAKPLDLRFMIAKLKGKTTARYWNGNDALKLVVPIPFRWFNILRNKITNLFVDTHYAQGYLQVARVFLKLGIRPILRPFKSMLEYDFDFIRQKNRLFTIIYYAPYELPLWQIRLGYSRRWLYGIDLIDKLKLDLPAFNWIVIRPGMYVQEEMKRIYCYAHLYLRPSRSDADPLMTRESIHYGCKAISTFGIRPETIHCNPEDYDDLYKKVLDVYTKWKNNE